MTSPNSDPVQPESEAQLFDAIVTSAEAIIQQKGQPDPIYPTEQLCADVPVPGTKYLEGRPVNLSNPSATIVKPIGRLAEQAGWTWRINYGLKDRSRSFIVVKDPEDPHAIMVYNQFKPSHRATKSDLQTVAEDLSEQQSVSSSVTRIDEHIGQTVLGSSRGTVSHDRDQERKRFWSVEQSAQAVEALIGSDSDLAHAVNTLAAGAPGIVRAIKERLADEVSYDPGEALTPDRIRVIVGAPSEQVLLGDWRREFYEPYKQKYRAEQK